MAKVPRPKVDVDLRPYFKGEERSRRDKNLIVLHETVSHNYPGVGDIKGVAAYMDRTGLEIHAIVDKEAFSAWCHDIRAVYDHTASNGGDVNTRSIGVEIVSEIPFTVQKHGRLAGKEEWRKPDRLKQLDKVSHWVAWWCQEENIPIRYSNGIRSGITSHWDVSQSYHVPGGHWDCWPVHRGGYFPLLYVVYKARQIRSKYEARG